MLSKYVEDNYDAIMSKIKDEYQRKINVVSKELNKNELEKFNFECQDFENIKLEKNNLLVANFSIPFCNKDYFDEFWKKIANSILKKWILCWKLFWIKRFLGKDNRTNGIFIKRTSIGIV